MQKVLEALSLVKAKDMTFLDVALIEAFDLFSEVRLFLLGDADARHTVCHGNSICLSF